MNSNRIRPVLLALFCSAGLLGCAVGAIGQGGKPGNKPGPTQASPAPSEDKAKKTLTVVVPQPGEYYIRLLPSADAKQAPPLPIGFGDKSKTFTYDPSSLGKAPRIAVDDAKTGNTAVIPPSGRFSPDGLSVELARLDFDHVRQVKVSVTYDNKPVQAAQVTLAAGDKTSHTKTVDPTSQGVAVFDDVPVGRAKLTVVYGDKLTETKDVDISGDHPAGALVVPAPVTNKVPTLDSPAVTAGGPTMGPAPATPGSGPAPAGPPAQAAPPAAEGGGISGLIGWILGFAVGGGLIYLLYRWSQSGGMAATLKKAGIETSGPSAPSDAATPSNPSAPAAPVVSDPSMCAFCGQKKDAAGNCACTLSGAALNTGPSSPAIPNQPRLVATMGVYSGSIFPLTLNGSGVTLGRELNNGIPLANDTTVSRRHASIRSEGGGYVVTDEGSSNGVYVNGVKISGSQPLNPGDEVQIGNTRFRFEL